MIDFTTTQSRDYLKTIEAPAVTQDQIDYKALEIMRGLTPLDMSDALHDWLGTIKDLTLAISDKQIIGEIVDDAIWSYCQRIAKRELEA